jgi:hypothetical protein
VTNPGSISYSAGDCIPTKAILVGRARTCIPVDAAVVAAGDLTTCEIDIVVARRSLQMATIKIDINTEGTTHSIDRTDDDLRLMSSKTALTATTLIIVSTIKIFKYLEDSFIAGANATPLIYDQIDYDDLTTKLHSLDGTNRFIVTVGGLIAYYAARNTLTKANFVSLVGTVPTANGGKSLGGVQLSSLADNSARVDFLVGKGRNKATIGLLCNKKSAMNTDEENNWKTIPGITTTYIIEGGNTGIKNDAGHFDKDLKRASDAGIETLIISADPFFFDNREKLIFEANNWVAGAGPGVRYVCYPIQDYANLANIGGNNHPTAKTASWYGPSLSEAYQAIGQCAALALTSSTSLGFSSRPVTGGDFS